MKLRTHLPLLKKFCLLVFLSLIASILPIPIQADDDDDYVEGQVVVKLNPASGATIGEINADYGTTILEIILASSNIYLLDLPDGEEVDEVIDVMEDDPRLLYAEPNYFSESPEGDPSETWAWGGYDPDPWLNQYAADLINLEAAHQITLGGGTVVAVLDTGAQLDHPALAPHFTDARYDFIDDDPIPDDEFNGLDDDADDIIDEGAGHGTHIAGIINLVAPNAQIMPLRVLDSDGRGNVFLAAEAILYAIQNGADVINLSFGTPEETEMLEDLIEEAAQAGVVLVAAAGNLDSSSEQYPAAEEDVIAVAAVGPDKVKTSFSNYGEWVTISAPGKSITSTFPVDGYAQWSGTSMATPFVSGQAALIRSVAPGMTAAEITTLIMDTADPIDIYNPNYEGELGAGLIDVGSSLEGIGFYLQYIPIYIQKSG
jgi:subtilisin family serine protease